ncbi:MAG: Na+/H+ antiporter NhaA [Gammaproteobacteria bacterium]|nr:Na+/H+ antiporter NhaA [Gammaproteobacteria bacterium]MCP5136699.1 Na+/H+ antiporter NhaA [Gammaproteobacteria bacterium]
MALKLPSKRSATVAPWEKAFDRFISPFEQFVHRETTGGMILIAATIVALLLANLPMTAEWYQHMLHAELGIRIGEWRLVHSAHHWINDGLMALFFFVVGLEIKREVLTGELSEWQQAILPIIAAIGGMVVPALIYYALNAGTPTEAGWGVPMATDIAFAVGVLALLGSRVPKALLTFLVALAIVDDLGAVIVIALFYTDDLVLIELLFVAVSFLLMMALNRFGIRKPMPYAVLALFMWMAMLESGVHATLAGVLAALTIPSRSIFEFERFYAMTRGVLDRLEKRAVNRDVACTLTDQEAERRGVHHALVNGVKMIETPAQRMEQRMHAPVAFVILPLFALANAGIALDLSQLGGLFGQPVAMGVVAGLVLGKLIGVAGVSLIAVRLGLAQMPTGVTPGHLVGVGLLAGIGFTMSIFIAELGLGADAQTLVVAKTAILAASLIAGVGGYLWLRRIPTGSAQS